MQNTIQNENMRESYRCSVEGSKRDAALRVGDEWIAVGLLDESAGGFGVLADRPINVSTGDLIQLRLGDERFEVRVMNLTEKPPEGGEEGPSFRLGLKRVGEALWAAEEKRPWYERFKRPLRHKPSGSAGAFFKAALVFAALIGALPVIAIYLMDTRSVDITKIGSGVVSKSGPKKQPWNSHKDGSGIREPGEGFGVSNDSPGGSGGTFNHEKLKRFVFGEGPSSNGIKSNGNDNAGLFLLLDHAGLKSGLGKWSDAVLAVIENLAKNLKLTDPQKEEINTILQDANDEIVQLHVPHPDNTPQVVLQKRKSILEAAYAKLIQVFTPQQQTEWNEAVQEWSEKP